MLLVNNAGMSPSRAGVSDMVASDLWRKIFAVNLDWALSRMSQCVAPLMRDNGGCSMINIGSMDGNDAGSAVVSAYGASKAAAA